MVHPSRLSLASQAKTKAIQNECLNLTPAAIIPLAVQTHLLNGMLCLAESLLEAEMQELVGTRWAQYPGRELKRYGKRHGQISVFGKRRQVQAPRVRIIGGKEMQLSTYALLNDCRFLTEEFAAAWLAADSGPDAADLLAQHLQSFDWQQIPLDKITQVCLEGRLTFLNPQTPDNALLAFFIDQIEFASKSYLAVAAVDSDRERRILSLRPGSLSNSADCNKIAESLGRPTRLSETDNETKELFIIADSSSLRRSIRQVFPQAIIHTCYDFDPDQSPGTRIEQEVEGTGVYSSQDMEATLQQLKSWSEAL